MTAPPTRPTAYAERPREWPLVGRERELEAIAAARAQRLPGVVIGAGAGIGKSRLAREAIAAAARDGAHVERVRATRSAAAVPLGAFAGVVPPDARADDLLGLLRGSVATLQERAGDRPLLLAVDDAQLLDPPSAALVLHLVESGAGFLLATVRDGDPCPDAIVSLWKDAGAQRLELRPFSAAETAELVERFLGGQVEQAALHWLHERSEGNALYVRELVLGALDGGALTQVRELWRLPRRPPVSATLSELVTARMAELTAAEREALELLAVGEPLRVEELAALVGESALVAVEARGMVVLERGATGGEEVRLAHPLYGEAIRAALGTLRARAARRQVAAAVQARPALDAGDALRLARLLLDAGEPVPPALLLDAAGAATGAGDPELAAQLAALAVDGGAGFGASLLLARAHAAQERFEQSEAVLAAIEGEAPDAEAAFAYLELRIEGLFWALRRRDELVALLERASAWWPDDDWRRRLQPLLIYATAAKADLFGSLSEQTAATLADPALDPEVRRQMEPLHVAQLFYAGRTLEARRLVREILPPIPLPGPTEELTQILWSTLDYECGHAWPALERELAEVFTRAVRAGDTVASGFAAVGIGALRLAAGEIPGANRWLAEAELQLERRDAIGVLAITRSFQVLAHHAAGDADRALAAAERMHATLGGEPPLPNQRPYVVRGEAWAIAADGDRSRAQELLLEAAGELGPMPIFAALLTHDALRLGAPARQVATPLRLLAERTDAPLAAAWSAHAAAKAADDGAALGDSADAYEAIGALRCATEAAADAAAAFLRAGREGSARRAAARSRELHGRGSGGTPPPIDGLDGPAVSLTPREAQLVELAARGLSNAEIADRLVLSVRTVESHIYRAMQKLGVSDRRELGRH
jgi:DNA-binding NarL/FixJ family response regulator